MIDNKPLVTIITVTYNSAMYVRETIIGVLSQTYKNIQYIIADDCSTDETWQIINEYKDDRIIAYRNETNLREYPNRNKAIEKAKGEYLIFIDGDDVILPTAIDYLMFYATKYKDAALFIQKNYFNNLLFPVVMHPRQSFINVYFGQTNFLNSSFTANFFKTSILKSNKGLATNFLAGDDEIRLKISSKHQIVLLQGWVSWPRETPNQASSKISILQSQKESFSHLMTLKNDISNFSDLDEKIVDEAIKSKLKSISIQVLYLIKKLKLKDAMNLMKAFNLSIFRCLTLIIFQPSFVDEFSQHTPGNPYKKDFIEFCNTIKL